MSENGHYCNGVIDPGTCCPLGHGETDERFCTCKVAPETAEAVRVFEHELYSLKPFRQFDYTLRKWVLRNHKVYDAIQTMGTTDGLPRPYKRVDCRLRHGSASVEEGNICGMCKLVVDWI